MLRIPLDLERLYSNEDPGLVTFARAVVEETATALERARSISPYPAISARFSRGRRRSLRRRRNSFTPAFIKRLLVPDCRCPIPT